MYSWLPCVSPSLPLRCCCPREQRARCCRCCCCPRCFRCCHHSLHCHAACGGGGTGIRVVAARVLIDCSCGRPVTSPWQNPCPRAHTPAPQVRQCGTSLRWSRSVACRSAAGGCGCVRAPGGVVCAPHGWISRCTWRAKRLRPHLSHICPPDSMPSIMHNYVGSMPAPCWHVGRHVGSRHLALKKADPAARRHLARCGGSRRHASFAAGLPGA